MCISAFTSHAAQSQQFSYISCSKSLNITFHYGFGLELRASVCGQRIKANAAVYVTFCRRYYTRIHAYIRSYLHACISPSVCVCVSLNRLPIKEISVLHFDLHFNLTFACALHTLWHPCMCVYMFPIYIGHSSLHAVALLPLLLPLPPPFWQSASRRASLAAWRRICLNLVSNRQTARAYAFFSSSIRLYIFIYYYCFLFALSRSLFLVSAADIIPLLVSCACESVSVCVCVCAEFVYQ